MESILFFDKFVHFLIFYKNFERGTNQIEHVSKLWYPYMWHTQFGVPHWITFSSHLQAWIGEFGTLVEVS